TNDNAKTITKELTHLNEYSCTSDEVRKNIERLYKKAYENFYKDLKQECQIEFDLLYDMLGLSIALKREWKNPLLYIHQGGIS
ncbi:hypothetical protein VWN94_10915, partial [Campylobacter coli]|nr:hypothetical protein [Campylobacter coli]